MGKSTLELSFRPAEIEEPWSVLEQIARKGAREMLQQALENEVAEYLEAHSDLRDENDHRVVVRNGYMPERNLVSGLGPVSIRQPRV